MDVRPSRTWMIGGALAASLVGGAAIAQEETPTSAALDLAVQDPYIYFVVDGDARPVYLFTRDDAVRPTCYDACAEDWPPVLTEEAPRVLSPWLIAGWVGTVKRETGELQVTYGGWPLYYYAGDAGTTVPSGQDASAHGGTWYLIAPDATAVTPTGEDIAGVDDLRDDR